MIGNIFIMVAVCAMTAESSALMTNRSRRSAGTCGVVRSISGLIVRGENFPRGTFPWIVALINTETGTPNFFCGGTLISKTFVISAAHCILEKHATAKLVPRDILALFGAHDLSNSHEPERITLSPKKIFIHDEWNPKTTQYDADVSLLEFEINKIHFDYYIQPICLWESTVETTVTEGIVTGWGKSEDRTRRHESKPRKVTATIHSNEKCFLDKKALVDLSSLRTFCAGLKNGSGVCFGDSGGGLIIKVDKVYYLKGIVSSSLTGSDGCDVSNNAVYTNVLKFRDWIKEITEGALVASTQAVRKVFCTFDRKRQLKTCVLNQTIHTEDYIIGSRLDHAVELFDTSANEEVKYLPRHIGENFPNLKKLLAENCGLTVLRNFYFKDMQNLDVLNVNGNKIATIESKAFRDLISVAKLMLQNNMIETLDEKIFATMVTLEDINLNFNKIKFLSPTTFNIPGGTLAYVILKSNVCIDNRYAINGMFWSRDLDQLEGDIRANCK